jgi:hypothetical protein
MKEFFERVALGAEEQDFARLVTWLGHRLPEAYVGLLREANGAYTNWGRAVWAEDWLGLMSVILVIWYNEDTWIRQYVAGTFAIGTCDRDAILLDTSAIDDPDAWPVLMVNESNLDRRSTAVLAGSFEEWRRDGFRVVPDKWH